MLDESGGASAKNSIYPKQFKAKQFHHVETSQMIGCVVSMRSEFWLKDLAQCKDNLSSNKSSSSLFLNNSTFSFIVLTLL